MMLEQCELRLFGLPQNVTTLPTSNKVARKQAVDTKSRYLTTNEVVERLKLDSPYLLRKSRANASAYRSDRYVVVPAGRNRWELFRQVAS
jgi:hypothetical protein